MINSNFSAPYYWGFNQDLCWNIWSDLSGGAHPLWCPPPLLSASAPRLQVVPHPRRRGGMRWVLPTY